MNKVLIYSIQSTHIANILNGLKKMEIRRRDLPQWALDIIKSGGVVEAYGYCTMGGKRLAYEKQPKHPYYILSNSDGVNNGNGKVVVKFQVSGVTKLPFISGYYEINPHDIPLKACLDIQQLNMYGKSKDLYAHYLTNITPIEPMELSNFYKWESERWHGDELGQFSHWKQLKRAYQSFGTAWVKGE